jgi:hypothetical protein
VDPGTPYIVMAPLDGESLADRLERVERLGPVEAELIIRRLGSVCLGRRLGKKPG